MQRSAARIVPASALIQVLRSGSGGRLAQGDGQLGLTGFFWIVEGIAGAIALAGLKEESGMLEPVRQTGEAGFAIHIGADFEIKFVGAQESVGDMDFDFGGVDGFVVRVGYGKVGCAGTDASIDGRDGMRVGRLRQCGDG